MENLIVGLVLSIIVFILYSIFLTKKDYKNLKKALNKSLKVLVQNSIRLFATFLIIGMLQNYLSEEAVGQFLIKFTDFFGIIVG